MIDFFARFFLSFTQETVLIPLIVGGYIWSSRRHFFQAGMIVLLSIMLSVALKATFRVPLAPSIGHPGFAFPSGHMQSVVVFYGFLACVISMWRWVYPVLLIGNAWALVHFGYHTWTDVMGAIFFGSILLIAFEYQRNRSEGTLPWASLAFAQILLVYVSSLSQLTLVFWQAYSTLMGLIFGQIFFGNKISIPETRYKHYFIAVLLTLGGIFLAIKVVPHYQLKWVLVGLMLPFGTYIASVLEKFHLSKTNT